MKLQTPFFLIVFLFLSCSKTTLTEEGNFDLDSIDNSEDPSNDQSSSTQKIPCENGFAGVYPCNGYDLIGHLSLADLESESANDNWGWTDEETGKEYVLSGLNNGTAFVDISDPEKPLYLGKLLTASEPSIWRDVKIYKNHAFVVSEASQHGLQVFDLTRLRNLTSPQNFTADATLSDFGNAHNIAINEATGYAYVIGSQLYSGGPVFIDIKEPKNPKVVGGYGASSYTHDSQIIVYNGPDSEHKDKEILFGSNSDGGVNNQLIIVDVTDKSNPVLLTTVTYSNGGYTHQGILSEDQRYFFLGDELDEIRYGVSTHTRVFDLTDLDAPQLHFDYFADVKAIDHNGYTFNNKFYLASYTAGMRVLDISKIEDKEMIEIGFFDTFPENDNPSFDGVWNVYPYFTSGIIAINDMNSGLFLVKASE